MCTSSIDHFVPLIAPSALSVRVMSSAGIVDGHTHSVGIEHPVLRAFNADAGVPGKAAGVSHLSIVGRRIDTRAIDKIVPSITGQALSKAVKGSTDVLNWDADSDLIEYPSSRAFNADTFLPNMAPRVSNSSCV